MKKKSWGSQYLYRNDPIKTLLLKLVVHNVTRDDRQVREPLNLSLRVDILLLRPRVREGGDLGFGEHLCEVQGAGTPAAPIAHTQAISINIFQHLVCEDARSP